MIIVPSNTASKPKTPVAIRDWSSGGLPTSAAGDLFLAIGVHWNRAVDSDATITGTGWTPIIRYNQSTDYATNGMIVAGFKVRTGSESVPSWLGPYYNIFSLIGANLTAPVGNTTTQYYSTYQNLRVPALPSQVNQSGASIIFKPAVIGSSVWSGGSPIPGYTNRYAGGWVSIYSKNSSEGADTSAQADPAQSNYPFITAAIEILAAAI